MEFYSNTPARGLGEVLRMEKNNDIFSLYCISLYRYNTLLCTNNVQHPIHYSL